MYGGVLLALLVFLSVEHLKESIRAAVVVPSDIGAFCRSAGRLGMAA